MIRVLELLPDDPVEAEAVLHVRRHLRASIRRQEPKAGHALAMLFGAPWAHGRKRAWRDAAADDLPLRAGAKVAAGQGRAEVSLGHDPNHVEECRGWLARRKVSDRALAGFVANDLATLLELSKARDYAQATGRHRDGRDRPLPILVEGETGTGKEVLARGIHRLSRSSGPFVVLSAAGKSPEAVMAELFGTKKGVFTGVEKRAGLFETTHGGTLLLDEVGDLSHDAQRMLLRVVEEGVVTRLGDAKEIKTDVRVVAATWHALDEQVEAKEFRQDLLQRLCGARLRLAPLRARTGWSRRDLPALLALVDEGAALSRAARAALSAHHWPGNLRELRTSLELATSLAGGEPIRVEHLRSDLQRAFLALPPHRRAAAILEDQFEGLPLTDEEVRHRATSLDVSVREAVEPEYSTDWSALARFLSETLDDHPDQQDTLLTIRDAAELEAERSRAAAQAAFWVGLRGDGFAPPASAVIEERVERMTAEVERIDLEVERAHGAAGEALAANPWWRMITDLRAVPILSEQDAHGIVSFVGLGMKVLRELAPEEADGFRELLASEGIWKAKDLALEWLRDELDEQDAVDVTGEPIDVPRVPAEASREFWVQLTSIRSLAKAAGESGFSRETVKKYLQLHDIENPWSRSSARARGDIEGL
jgi:MoxR-like ATPase